MKNELLAASIVRAMKDYEKHYGAESTATDLSHLLLDHQSRLTLAYNNGLDPVSAQELDQLEGSALPESMQGVVDPIEGVADVKETVIWTPSQELALGKLRAWLNHIKQSQYLESTTSRFFLLRGYAGTGKSFLMKTVLDENSSSQNLLFSAPTHQAARILSAYVGRQATTVASRLGVKAVYTEDQLEFALPERLPYIPPKSILIVDESSMLNKEYVQFLVKLAEDLDVYILFVGDPLQLPPVGETRSSVWSLVKDNHFRHTLVDVKRTSQPQLLGFLSDLREQITGKSYQNNLRDFGAPGEVDVVDTHRAFLRNIRDQLDQFKDGSAKVVAWRNKKVNFYSAVVRELLGLKGTIAPGDRLRLSGSFIPYESVTVGEVGVATEEILVREVKESVLTPNLYGSPWGSSSIPVLVAEVEGQTFDRHAVAIPDPERNGPHLLSQLLNTIAITARNARKQDARVYWEHFWHTKRRFIEPRSAYTNTAHTFQGSQSATVFMDTEDILANPTKAEAFRCWYVAASRSTQRLVSN